jgi:diacylglycerol kinase (ATP)
MGSSAKRIVVAINPNASFGRTRHVGPSVVTALKARGHDVVPLSAPDYDGLVRVARDALSLPTDALVVVGGDGMVNLGVNLVAGTPVPLGIVPAGTGNDFATGLGVPVDTAAATTALADRLEEGARRVDAAVVSGLDGPDRWFAGALSAGFDARVNERANAMRRPKGASRYVIALVAELVRLRSRRYRLTIDGEPWEVDSVLLSVANNTMIGGGMRIAPDAVLDDGLLDVFVVAPVGRARFIRLFPKVFSGTHTGLDIVEFRRGRVITLDAEGITAFADGEPFGPLPVTVTLHPGALGVLA